MRIAMILYLLVLVFAEDKPSKRESIQQCLGKIKQIKVDLQIQPPQAYSLILIG